MAWKNLRPAVLAAAGALIAIVQPATAKDRPYDRDWQTGIVVAPGAQTWTADNLKQKQGLIRDIASRGGKTCSDYAFLGWPGAAGSTQSIQDQTRRNYEAAGYTVEESPGDIPTDTVWTVAGNGREATILWGSFGGSTVYLSCITAGEPAPNPDKPLYLAVILPLAVVVAGLGLWLMRRQRAQAAASLSWPTTQATVTASEVTRYKAQGGPKFMAKIGYDYAVGGTSHSGSRLRFGNYATAETKAREDAAAYPVGAKVDVRYDPADPGHSVLEPGGGGISVSGVALAGIGGVMLLMAALIAVFT